MLTIEETKNNILKLIYSKIINENKGVIFSTDLLQLEENLDKLHIILIGLKEGGYIESKELTGGGKIVSIAIKRLTLKGMEFTEQLLNGKLSTQNNQDKKVIEQNTYNNSNIFISNENSIQNITLTINNQQNNIEELKNVLRENGIEENDITDLEQAIISETPDVEKKTYGEKVKCWIKNITAKAVDGSLQIALPTVTNLITEVLKKHYGF